MHIFSPKGLEDDSADLMLCGGVLERVKCDH